MQKNKNKNNEHNDSLRVLIDLIPDPAIVIDSTRTIVAANSVLEKYSGYSKKELVGKSLAELSFIDEHYKQLIMEKMKKRFEKSNIPAYEITLRAKNGEVRRLEVKGTRIRNEGKSLDLVVFDDVTERSKHQQQLQQDLLESEEKFQGITNFVRDAIIVVNEEAQITYWNSAAEKIFGYSSEAAVGKDLHQLVVPNTMCKEGKARIEASVKTFAETGTGYFTVGDVELVGRRKDGSEFPAKLAISPIKFGGKWSAVGLVKDLTNKKQTDQKMREAEQRYYALFDQARLGVLVVDPKTALFVEFNDKAHLQLDYSREEFKKLTIFDIEAKESTDETKLHIMEMITQGGGEFETLHLTKNGDIKNVLVTTRAIEFAGKKLLHCIFHDITKQKQMETSVDQERAMLENITENIGAGLVIVNRDYRILWTNNFLKTLNGDVCNKMCYSTFNTLKTVCPDCGPKKIFEGAQLDTREYLNKELQDKGQPCWFELIATSIRDKDGKVIAALELTVDITEKKKLEEKIREERNKLEAITENISASLMLLDKDYRITWMNKFGKQLHGEVVNQTCYSAIHGRDHICLDCGAEKIFGRKIIDIHELTVNKNGKNIILEVTATPMKDKEGNVVGVLELGLDITEIKKLQCELSKYSQRLEDLVKQRTEQLKQTQTKLVKSERLAAIGELAGMVGHDLRNPLSGIKNATYFLKKKGKTIPESQADEMLETIDSCVNYSNKIVSDLLDYSREIHLDLQDYSPRNLIIESMAIMDVPEKVEILNNVSEKPLIKVDPDKIKRVFINLIKNGIEAMPNVGKLTIDSKEANGELEISFADTGVGIPDEILPKLFAPLFTTKAQGMGFGLAICKRIVEAHGGTIAVRTANGAGTTFKVTLPTETENEIGGEKVWIETPKFSLSTMTKT